MGNVQRLGRRLPGLFQLIAIAEHRSINKAADGCEMGAAALLTLPICGDTVQKDRFCPVSARTRK